MEDPESESFLSFMSGKMTEENYIKRTSWQEIQMLRENPWRFSKYLLRFRDPGNRRNALIHSMPIKRDALEKLLMSGSSLVTDLKRPSTRQIRPLAIAKFGIIYRVTFSWGSSEYPGESWDNHNFDYLGDCLITSREELILKLSPEPSIEWSVNGYQLKLEGTSTLYLRLECRSGLVILDLINPRIDTLELLAGILKMVNCKWRFQQIPSLVIGHSFYIFFGAMENDIIDKVVKEEYPLIKQLYDLSAIYGGK